MPPAIEIAQDHSRFDPDPLARGVDLDALQGPKMDDEGRPRLCRSRPHCGRQIERRCEGRSRPKRSAGDDGGHARGLDDGCRPAIVGAVPHGPGRVVVRVLGEDDAFLQREGSSSVRDLTRPARVSDRSSLSGVSAPMASAHRGTGSSHRSPPATRLNCRGRCGATAASAGRHHGNLVCGAIGDGHPWRRSREVASWGASPDPRGTRRS